MSELVALLGRSAAPTDGVADYCGRLADALRTRGHRLERVRLPWNETGWRRALWWLWRQSGEWRGRWVLLQYTAMSWSRRGFPLSVIAILAILRIRSCRIAIVFHDPAGFPGDRWIDHLRRRYQHCVMRTAYLGAERAILTVPLDRVTWLPSGPVKAACISVGSNVPAVTRNHRGVGDERTTVAVFGVTGAEAGRREVAEIARAVRCAAEAVPRLRLVVLGRGSREVEGALRLALDDVSVDVRVLGLLPAEDVSRQLSQADVLLFVRGSFSGQRGSGVAAIACGLPLVGYSGPQTGAPVTEAGVILVPPGDDGAVAAALTTVLSDNNLWRRLHERSIEAHRRHFSWDAISEAFIATLRL